MFRCLFSVGLLLCAAMRCSAQESVWIDTDVSIGSPLREVDDGFALMLAFHSPELRIAGISTTYGNASRALVDRVAVEMANRFGSPARLSGREVSPGAAKASDLGRPTAASQALASALRRQRLTYIAIGPLTNLATALQLHPQLAQRIKRVVFLGGTRPGERLAFGRHRSFAIHDANVFKDPAAVQCVLQSGVPIVLVPISTAGKLQIDKNDLRTIAADHLSGAYLARRSQVWLWFWKHFVGADGGPLFDPVVVTASFKRSLIKSDTRYAWVGHHGELLVDQKPHVGARRVTFCPDLNPKVKTLLLCRLKCVSKARR